MKIANPIETIENQLFEVVAMPLTVAGDDLGFFDAPTTRGIYKGHNGQRLGEVGKDFRITQPSVLFNSFVECFEEMRDIDMSTLEYQETKGGSKIRFRIKVADYGFKNEAGKVDDLNTYLTLTAGYDGLTKVSLALESFRLICTNGMKILGTAANVAIKNTKGNLGKIQSICDDVAKVVAKNDDMTEWFKYLNTIEITEVKKQQVIEKALGYNKNTEGISPVRLLTLEEVEKSIALELSRTGSNMWGLLNGITHFTNHGEAYKTKSTQAVIEDRNDYVFQAGGSKINDRAQRAIMELVK